MRPLLAILVSATILSGMYLFMWQRARMKTAAPQVVEEFARDIYSLDLTCTFRAERDSFAFEDDPVAQVRFRGEKILVANEPVEAGEVLQVKGIDNIVVGHDEQTGTNEFYYEILTGDDAGNLARCVRLQLFRDGQLLAEKSAWSDPGEPVRGTLRLTEIDQEAHGDHDHGE